MILDFVPISQSVRVLIPYELLMLAVEPADFLSITMETMACLRGAHFIIYSYTAEASTISFGEIGELW